MGWGAFGLRGAAGLLNGSSAESVSRDSDKGRNSEDWAQDRPVSRRVPPARGPAHYGAAELSLHMQVVQGTGGWREEVGDNQAEIAEAAALSL